MTGTIEIDRSRAKATAREAFEQYGISRQDADVTADMLVTAQARGKQLHGLIRLPRYVRGIDTATSTRMAVSR